MYWFLILVSAAILGSLLLPLPPPFSHIISLPPPAPLSPHILVTHLTRHHVASVVMVTGGESITRYQDDTLATGTLDGHLVGFHRKDLSIKWRVKCPAPPGGAHSDEGPSCRILGLRTMPGNNNTLLGVDMKGLLFRFTEGHFEWLLDEKTPGILVTTEILVF